MACSIELQNIFEVPHPALRAALSRQGEGLKCGARDPELPPPTDRAGVSVEAGVAGLVLQEKRPAQGTQTPAQSGVAQSPTFRKMPIGGYRGSGPVEMNSTPPDGWTIKSEWNFLDAYGSWSRGGASSETVGF